MIVEEGQINGELGFGFKKITRDIKKPVVSIAKNPAKALDKAKAGLRATSKVANNPIVKTVAVGVATAYGGPSGGMAVDTATNTLATANSIVNDKRLNAVVSAVSPQPYQAAPTTANYEEPVERAASGSSNTAFMQAAQVPAAAGNGENKNNMALMAGIGILAFLMLSKKGRR